MKGYATIHQIKKYSIAPKLNMKCSEEEQLLRQSEEQRKRYT